MNDDNPSRGRPDRMHLNLDDEEEVVAMARSFCVTPQELRDAVETTGTNIGALEAHFQSQ